MGGLGSWESIRLERGTKASLSGDGELKDQDGGEEPKLLLYLKDEGELYCCP